MLPHIKTLKDLHLVTDLTGRKGLPVELIAPEGETAGEAVRRLTDVLHSVGCEPLVRELRETDPTPPPSGHVVALGSLTNNRLLERLYCDWYTLVDAYYPGPGGWVLQSIHNPWGNGTNVVVLGASDASELPEVAQAFAQKVQSTGGLFCEPLLQVQWSSERRPERESIAEYLETGQGHPWGFGLEGDALVRTGLYYVATGDVAFAQRFREGILTMAATRPETVPEQQVHLSFFPKMVLWDLLEESPVFSDEERLQVTNYLLEVLRSTEGAANPGFLSELQVEVPRQNHQTAVALGLYFGARYFRKYYALAEADEWLAEVAKLFAVFNEHSKPICDCNCHGWSFTLEHAATYAFAEPSNLFFANGMAREAAERAILCCNNLGYMPVLGDCDTDRSYPVGLFQRCAHSYRDGRYAFMVEKRVHALGRSASAPRQLGAVGDELGRGFDAGVTPTEPKDLVGVRVARLDPLYFELAERSPERAQASGIRKANIPHERSFDKLCFRSGFSPSDQYLLLDGVGGGSHSYDDQNSIVEFGEDGRTFIVTEDNLHWPDFSDHNVVTVLRDGRAQPPPTFAGCEFVSDIKAFGFSRTFLRDYNGVDWVRNLLWRKGEYFVVVDDVVARVPGDYSLDCRWKVLGVVILASGRLVVTQGEDVYCVLDNVEGEHYRLEEVDFGAFLDDEERERSKRHYDMDRLVATVLHQMTTRNLLPGGRHTFINLIYASSPHRGKEYRACRAGDRVVSISGLDGVALVGIGDSSPVRAGKLLVEAAHFCVTADTFALARGRSLEWGIPWFRASEPIDIEYNFFAGAGVAVAERETDLTLLSTPAEALTVDGAKTASQTEELGDGRCLHHFRLPAGRHEIRAARKTRTVSKSLSRPLWTFEARSPVTEMDFLTTSTEGHVFVGTASGSAHHLSPDGACDWTFKAAARINSVCAVPTEGGVKFVVGGEDCRLILLDEKGEEEWRFEPEFGIQYWPWWTLGSSKVLRVRSGDLNGDGAPEIVAAVGNMRLHVLDVKGKELWSRRTDHGLFVTMRIVDVDGDGCDEIVGGMAVKASHSTCLVFDGRGEVRKRYLNQGWTSQLTAVAVGDLNGDGRLEVACGTNRDDNVRVFDVAEQRLLWSACLGDAVTGLVYLPGDSPRLIAASSCGQLCCYDAAGAVVWHCSLETPVRALVAADLDGCGNEEVALGLEDGTTAVHRNDGQRTAHFHAAGAVTALKVLTGSGIAGTPLLSGGAAGSVQCWRLGKP